VLLRQRTVEMEDEEEESVGGKRVKLDSMANVTLKM